MQVPEKVGKLLNALFLQCFVALEGRKVGSMNGGGAEPFGRMRDQKLHAAVARSTFSSQNAEITPTSEHLSKWRC